MKTLRGMVITALLMLGCGTVLALDKPLKVVFEGKNSEHKWILKDLDPNLPSDWSGCN